MNCEYCKCQVFERDRACPRCGAPVKFFDDVKSREAKLSQCGNMVSGSLMGFYFNGYACSGSTINHDPWR